MLNPDSKYLSERLISRLSPQRRANLERRINEQMADVGAAIQSDDERFSDPANHYRRTLAMVGRLAALTA